MLLLCFPLPRLGATWLDFFKLPPRAIELLHDVLDLGRPEKRTWLLVPGSQIFLDRLDQIGHAQEYTSANHVLAQLPKPPFHHVQPAGAGRGEVADKPGMFR